MNQLGPYKKYVILAAVIQSIIVVIVGIVLFKSKVMKEPIEHKTQERPVVEEPLNSCNWTSLSKTVFYSAVILSKSSPYNFHIYLKGIEQPTILVCSAVHLFDRQCCWFLVDMDHHIWCIWSSFSYHIDSFKLDCSRNEELHISLCKFWKYGLTFACSR